MSNNPEARTPFSEHDFDLIYRFHIGEIDMPELQSRLEFWRPARQLTQKALRTFGKRWIRAGWTPEELEIVAQLCRKEIDREEALVLLKNRTWRALDAALMRAKKYYAEHGTYVPKRKNRISGAPLRWSHAENIAIEKYIKERIKHGESQVIPFPFLPGRSRQSVFARISRVRDDMAITHEQWKQMRPDNARVANRKEAFHDAWSDSTTGSKMKKLRDSASATSTIMRALDMLGKALILAKSSIRRQDAF